MAKLTKADDNPVLNLNYSRDEQWTGEYWIDGKKIYRKTVYASIAPGTNTVAHGVSNIGSYRVFDLSNSYWIAGTQFFSYNVKENSESIYLIRIGANYISTQASDSWGNYPGYITIRYTKTTD